MLNDPFRGYDQWKTASPYDDDRYEDFIDKCCNECIFLKSCPLAVGDITELNCLVIRGIIDKQNQEMFEAEQAREAQEEGYYIDDPDDYPGHFYVGSFPTDAPAFTGGIDYRR